MPHKVSTNVAFCRVDDCLVFLDVSRDRYFQLPASLEQAFEAYLHGGTVPEETLRHLVERDVLTESPAVDRSEPKVDIDMPRRSALERSYSVPRLRAFVLLEVMLTVYWIRWQLEHQSISHVFDNFVRYARERVSSPSAGPANNIETALLDATDAFWRGRLYTPIEPTCLLDSLALARFLARRGHPSAIVFGVMCNPFAAHCWVQVGDMALNETVGGASTYTPIRRLP